MKLYIWWTDQKACEANGPELPKHFPKWLKDEYQSRLGRNGRGRLWVPAQFCHIKSSCEVAFFEFPPMAKWLAEDFAGIVIDVRAKQFLHRHRLAGLITDFDLKLVGGKS